MGRRWRAGHRRLLRSFAGAYRSDRITEGVQGDLELSPAGRRALFTETLRGCWPFLHVQAVDCPTTGIDTSCQNVSGRLPFPMLAQEAHINRYLYYVIDRRSLVFLENQTSATSCSSNRSTVPRYLPKSLRTCCWDPARSGHRLAPRYSLQTGTISGVLLPR